MLLALLSACGPEGVPLDSGGGGKDSPPTLELSAPAAFDPILGGPLSITATSDGGTPSLSLIAADGSSVATGEGTLTWDGHAGAGWATPGVYTVEATITDPDSGLSSTREADVGLVRVGIDTLYVGDGTDGRLPLYWHTARELQDLADPVTSIPNLDDGTDLVLFPEVGAGLGEIEADKAQPVAYAYDSRPVLTLQPGTSLAIPTSGLADVEVYLAIEGWEVISGNPMADGVPVVVQKLAGIAEGPGVAEGELQVQFLAGSTVIGAQAVPYRAYALFGAPTWEASGPQYNPWVAVVDPALRGIDGVTPVASDVVDALVEWIYYESGLSYDTVAGATVYTNYLNGWLDAEFMFTAFLERRWGTVVNCTDCASILSGYANMLGARLDYVIILQNFQLNQIKAIGGTEFSNCPFPPWGCGFSYHAVTTTDAGDTIWDATLALDGDEDPGSLPSEELLVQTLDGEEYLDRLVKSGNTWYQYDDQITIK